MSKKKRRPAKRRPDTRVSSRQMPKAAVLALLTLLGVGLYANTLGHQFVFDDGPLIVQNPQVYNLSWGEIFSSGGYRPIRTFTYAVNYALGAGDPFGYHLFNILLHALNGILLFLLLATWSRSSLFAFAGAVVFLIHPVQSAAVAYVSGRKDLLATFFILAGMIVYTRYRRSQQKRQALLLASLGLFLLGVFSKEVAIIFPALLLLADGFALARRPNRQGEEGWLESLRRFPAKIIDAVRQAPLLHLSALLLAGLGLFYAVVITQATRMVGSWGGSYLDNLGTSFKLFAHYLKLVFWPHPLIADYKGDVFNLSSGFLEPATLAALLLAIAFLASAAAVSLKRPLLSLGMLWFAAALLPVLHVIPFHELAADHFLYLPMVGVAMAAGVLMQELALRPRAVRFAWAGFAIIVLTFTARTFLRNQDWKDDQTLWAKTYESAPGSFRANTNLGRLYFESGRNDHELRVRGLEMTKKALELIPDEPVALANLGGMNFEMARLAFEQRDDQRAFELADEAASQLRQALQGDFANGSILNNLGNCYKLYGNLWERQGDSVQALENRRRADSYYRDAVNLDPRREIRAAYYNWATLYMEAELYDQAIPHLRSFFESFPDGLGIPVSTWADAHGRMGLCHIVLGRYRESLPYLQTAVRLKPSLDNLGNLAKAYEESSQIREAIGIYQQTLQRYPQAFAAHYNLGVLFTRLGEFDAAQRHFEQTLRLSDNPGVTQRTQQELEVLKAMKIKSKQADNG